MIYKHKYTKQKYELVTDKSDSDTMTDISGCVHGVYYGSVLRLRRVNHHEDNLSYVPISKLNYFYELAQEG